MNNHMSNLIGNTPTLVLKGGIIPEGKELILKLEYFNPNFSIKDRTAWGLLKYSKESGILKNEDIIIESTSGNLGKSIAMFGAIEGIKTKLVIDPKLDQSVINLYKAYGAEVVLVNDKDESGNYQRTRIEKVKSIIKEDEANSYFWLNQYENNFNQKYHYEHTSLEFLQEEFEFLTSAVSTGGHLTGIAQKVKESSPLKMIIGVDVLGSCIFEQNKQSYLVNGAGLAWKSSNINFDYIDNYTIVSDELAISLCRYFAKEYGVLVGGSSGLSIAAAIKVLRSSDKNRGIAIVPDTGINYLNQIYDDNWIKDKNVRISSSEKDLINLIDKLELKECPDE